MASDTDSLRGYAGRISTRDSYRCRHMSTPSTDELVPLATRTPIRGRVLVYPVVVG